MVNSNKRCIFHIPNYIDINRKSASNIRPLKMINAFKDNGYIVDVVIGYAKDRKKQIKQIKNNIRNGIKYDFLYSESSTMPTLLTETHHLPTHPFLDFSFIKYCKKQGLKIGLFYRDMHWKFNKYKKSVPLLKRIFAVIFYKFDLYKYRGVLNYLYLPSIQLKQYLPQKNKENTKYVIDILPPGCDIKKTSNETINVRNKGLNIFYVGGISEEVYNFEELFRALQEDSNIKFTVCCRENDWKKIQKQYSKYLNKNINIVHAGVEELDKYYREADVCSLLFKEHEYMKIAMPVKMFEYISYNKPIIATNGTIAGDFVQKNDIGWTIDYNYNIIKEKLHYLKDNKEEIQEKRNKQAKIIENNTWEARANKVIKDLVTD